MTALTKARRSALLATKSSTLTALAKATLLAALLREASAVAAKWTLLAVLAVLHLCLSRLTVAGLA